MEGFMQIKRYESGKRMSQAVVYSGFAFLAGQVADDPSQDVKGQTKQILAKIDRLLEQVGSDYNSFNEMNEVWDGWVPEGDAPARACVESKLAFPQYTVEIGVIAAV
jgi:enamine deaminase RidA (YjgF/YER057c/UK114 family)